MKYLTLFCLFFMFQNNLSAQLTGWQDKVSWSHKIEKINDHEAYIVSTATLKSGWHVFSVNHEPEKADLTGYPTTFNYPKSPNYKLLGKVIDGKKAVVHKDELGVSLYFEGTGVFKQKIEVLTKDKFEISFDFSFQICDENGCLFPPDQTGKVIITGYSPKNEKELTTSNNDLIINGDYAKDNDGNNYILLKGEWIIIPAGNSPKFYKKYLELGGKNEN